MIVNILKEVQAGDIGTALGLKNTFTGETLCDSENPVILENDQVP